MKINKKAKRVWFITDTHLGVRNSSNDWIDYMDSYFSDWLIPLIRDNYLPGDVLIHLGDVYDSRQSLNLKVLNLGIKVFESLSDIFLDGIYIIVGNHDLWGKSSSGINSLKSLKWIPRVNIFEEPETLTLDSKKFFMMPWRKDHEEEETTLEKALPHDVLCCHTDIRGLKFNRYVNVDSGASQDKFSKFGRVYSGHIHYAQKSGNINMLGSPYELTRSDMDNQKSITLLDLSTMGETVYNNDFSPKFKKFFFSDILEMTPEEVNVLFKNNFVDVLIDPLISLKAPLNILTDMVTSQRSLKFHPYDPNQTNLSEQIIESEGKQFNVLDFIKDYVDNMECDKETRSRIIKGLTNLHKIVVAQEQDNRIS